MKNLTLLTKALLISAFLFLILEKTVYGQCNAVPPIVTVTENTCDPVADGFYDIAPCPDGFMIEFSIDGGTTFDSTVPTYPTPFIVRCVEEICAVADVSGLDPSMDAVDQVNMGNVMLGGATLTIMQTFNGSSTLDENEITASQTTGDVGISTGVSHECIEDVCGQIDNSVNNLYNFDMPVCNLTIDLWDLDRDDEMLLTATGPNGPVTYVVNTIGMGVTQTGANIFGSNNPNVNYPGGGPATLGMFSVTFDDCVTQISIDYYDASNTAGDGGSFTIVFQEGCTATDCISEETAAAGNPIVCTMCPEDLVANLIAVDPSCLGQTVDFDASSSIGQNIDYEWDFDGDGLADLVTSVPTASFTYTLEGTFTVILTVVDPSGECDPAQTSIDVVICGPAEVVCPIPIVDVNEGDPIDTMTLGQPIVTATACNPDVQITINDDIGPGDCDLEEVISRVFIIADDCGISECVQRINVINTDPPVLTADLADPPPTCFAQAATLDASGSSGAPDLQYEWDFDGDGVIDQTTTTPVVTFSFPNPGVFTVFVTVSAPNSPCPLDPVTTSVEIIICDVVAVICPPATVTIVDGEPMTPADLGEPLISTNECNPNPILTFIDDVGPGGCPAEELITRTFTISDNCGLTQCTQTIEVLVDNPASINSLPIVDEICLGDAIVLDASASIGDALTYCWDVGIGTPTCDYMTPTASHVYTAPGIYTVTLSIEDQFGCTDTEVVGMVTVYETPEAIATIDFDPCTLTLTYDGSSSEDNFPSDNLIFTWDFGDGSTSGTELGTYVFDNCAAANTITLTVVDPDIPFPACNVDQLTFTVETDSEPPVLVCPPVADLQCGDPIPTYDSAADFIAAGGQASDNCGIVNFDLVSIDTLPGNCPYIFQVSIVYEASDICGNSNECTQIFNLLPGLPAASFPPDLILSCGDDTSQAVTGTPDIQASMCMLDATFTSTDVIISGSCPGDATIERTFIITDGCGNTIEETQIITIVNDIVPVLEGPPDVTINCTDACDPDGTGGLAVVVDSCMPIDGTTNTVTVTFEDVYEGFDGTVYPGGIIGFIIRTFTAVDECGNTGIYVQTISIERGEVNALVCNDRINVSLNSECDGLTPDFLLEAPADTKYFLSLEDGQFGFSTDPQTVFDSIDFSIYIESGQPINYTIADLCGNTCWGEILIESNVIPDLDSPCDFILGNIVDESGSIGDGDDTNLNELLGNNDDPIRGADLLGTVIITDGTCQDAFVIGNSGFRYNKAPKGAELDIEYVNLELYFVNVEDGSVIPFSFPTGVIGVTPLTDLVQVNGEYDVYVSIANGEATGDYSLHIEIGSCLPPCETICGSEYPDEFISPEEIEDILDVACNATLIGDLIIDTEISGDMCDGIVHIVTISGQFSLHGETVKEEILTQAYIELPINLDDDDIVAPGTVLLECGDDVTPEAILELTEDGTLAYPHYFDFSKPINDTICLEEVVVHYDVVIDTVQELVVVDDLWVLLDIVKKERRDSMMCVREGLNPVDQFEPILLDSNLCNVLIEYSDVVIETCASGKKIIREWSIIDWCRRESRIMLNQNIEVVDDVAPTIEKADDITLSIDPWTCAAIYELPELAHTDNCDNSELTESWSVSEGRVVDGYAVDLWLTDEPILAFLDVTDDCGNVAKDTVMIVVTDLVPPVPVCNSDIAVSLTSAMLNDNGGGGRIEAASFDGGSHDGGCGKIEIQVRRVNGCCFDECVPVYECISSDDKTGECLDSIVVANAPVFGDYVKFCCEDVGSAVMVEMLVTDQAGNANSCTVSVIVEDKTQSSLVCESVTVDCSDDLSSMTKPILSGTHCQLEETQIQMIQETELSGACGVDQIIREWYIDRDGSGEFSSGDPFCQQIILIDLSEVGIDPYSIKWPRHFNGEIHIGRNLECDDENEVRVTDDVSIEMGAVQICSISEEDYGEPVWCVSECSLIASSVEQDTIFSSDACFKLINRWTVIDWCKWEANGSGVDDDNDSSSDTFIAVEDWAQGVCAECPGNGALADGPVYFAYEDVEEDGYYTFDQIVKVIDDASPEIDAVDSYVVLTTGGAVSKTDATSCTGQDIITATVTDFCGEAAGNSDLIKWQVTVFKNDLAIDIKIGNGSIIEMNTGLGSPGDIHEIEWVARDGCGNQTTAITTVEFGDETLPTPICIAGVSTNIPNGTEEVVVWPADLDLGSFDNCTDADELRFVIVDQGVTPIMPGEDGFEDQGNFVLTCDDSGTLVFVDMWVFDANGNGDFCESSIQISGGCGEEAQVDQGASNFLVSGNVYGESGEPIMNTIITLNSNQEEYPKSVLVGDEGEYLFNNNREDFNYEISAENNLNPGNGVSTFDLLLMQQHIIQTQLLESPYKIIAADINYDGGVSVADIVEARELILGKVDGFEFNESWRFINSDNGFLDETNPWPFAENRFIENLSGDSVDNDFIGVKIGDLNNTAVSSNLSNSEIRYKEASTMVISKVPTDATKVNLKIAQESIKAIQFALNTGANTLVDVQSPLGLTTNNYHVHISTVGISWHSDEDLPVVFEVSLQFANAVSDKDLEMLTLANNIIYSEVVNGNADVKSVSLDMQKDPANTYVLGQNSPNPFSKITLIDFYVPQENESLTLRIYDITGKEVFNTTGIYSAGYHSYSLRADQIGGVGTYYYKLIADEWSDSKTLVITH
jgi:PKD repeat protein